MIEQEPHQVGNLVPRPSPPLEWSLVHKLPALVLQPEVLLVNTANRTERSLATYNLLMLAENQLFLNLR